MICSNECRFCAIQEGKKTFEIVDSPIIENENFYLMSSIGALIEGWTMVIPRQHSYSMKKYYADSSFYSFINESINIIKKAYGVNKVVVFEHGANKFGSMTACGTNHAHIHIVPINESLLNDITESISIKKLKFDQVEDYVKSSEYLLYADVFDKFENSDCYVHLLNEPISQFFRRIIANKLGCPDKYNYKEYDNIGISSATVITLQKELRNEE